MNKPIAVSSRILLDIPCKVCQDHSSGKHYGIFACDGCAGFFKRSIRRNRQYVCKAKGENSCIVDKTHRNQCRACRLQKCIEAGMNKDAVQHERGPRNSTIRRHVALYLKEAEAETANMSSHHVTMGSSPFLSNPSLRTPPILHPRLPSQVSRHQMIPSTHLSQPPVFPSLFGMVSAPPASNLTFQQSKDTRASISQSPTMVPTVDIQSSMLLHPTPKYPHELAIHVPTMSVSPESLCEAAARILFMNVKWAKSVPAFTSLPFSDQLLLLEESWRDLFVLGASQFMLPVDVSSLLTNLFSDKDGKSAEKSAMANEIKNFQEIMVKFKQMNVDPTEYTCLRAIILFKTDFQKRNERNANDSESSSNCSEDGSSSGTIEIKTLKEVELASSLQDQAQVALSKYIHNVYPTQPFRFGKLLLMLPSLKTVTSSAIQELFFKRTIGEIPMERLLSDMYKSREF